MTDPAALPRPFLKEIVGNKVFKNFSYLTAGAILSQLASLVSILKITYLLSPDEYGLLTFFIAQGTLLHVIGNIGSSSVVIRSVSRNCEQTNNLVYNGLALRSISLFSACCVYVIYNSYYGSLTSVQLGLIFAFSFVNVFANLMENIFHGFQRMFTPSLINLLYSLSWLLVVYSLSKDSISVSLLFYLYLLLNLLKSTFYLICLKAQKLLRGAILSFGVASKKLWKESWPYFLSILIMLPVTSFSSNFLDINANVNEIGYFNLSQRLIGPVFLVISIVFTAIFPNLSSLWIKDEVRFKKMVSIGFTYFMLATLLLCFLFNLFAEEVVVFLFPPSYLPAIAVCKMQIWYIFLTSIDSLIGTILGATNKERLILRFGVIYCLLSTPLFFWGSKFGALGLSWGYVLSFGISMLYIWPTFKKALQIKIHHGNYFWMLAIALFLISILIPSDYSFPYKLLVFVPVLGGIAYYFRRTHLLMMDK